MEIKYGGEDGLHAKIIAALKERIRLGEEFASDNYDRWQKAERYYQMYKIPNKKDGNALLKWNAGDTDFKSVVMPYSYAQLMTAHAYLVNVFLNRDPIFQADSLNGDGADRELALESLLQYQVKGGEMEPRLMVWFMDILRYGVGFIGNFWTDEVFRQTVFVDEEEVIDGVPTGNMKEVRTTRVIEGYKGNKLFNVLPYDALPDPRVAICNANEGEFFGRKISMGIMELKKNARRGDFFNIKEAEEGVATGPGDRYQRDQSMGETAYKNKDSTRTPQGKRVGDIDVVEMYVRLVPKDWGLGESDYPEIWVFMVANNKVIIYAEPANTLEDKFPIHAQECEVDGYMNKSRGILEVAAPMNDILTWLFDSHMYNKRQVMNNQFVGDPSAIVMKDVERKDPGKFIRLRPTAYGRDVRSIISQLPVTDVTMQNLQDVQVVERNMQRIVGINDDVAGQSAPSSRRSATEFRGTSNFASNRLANLAYSISVGGFRSLSKSLFVSSQQLYDIPMKVKVAGDNIKGLQSITVNPEDIAGQFDVVPVDGTLPIDRMGQAQFWMQIMSMVATNPMLAAEYRLGDIFSYTARLAGLKGIDKMKMRVLNDDQILALLLAQQQGGGSNVQPQQTVAPAGTGGAPSSPQPEAPNAGQSAQLGGLAALL